MKVPKPCRQCGRALSWEPKSSLLTDLSNLCSQACAKEWFINAYAIYPTYGNVPVGKA